MLGIRMMYTKRNNGTLLPPLLHFNIDIQDEFHTSALVFIISHNKHDVLLALYWVAF